MTITDAIVHAVIAHLRNIGPATRKELSCSMIASPRGLDRALKKAKNDGLIEYSKVGEDRRCYWRLVERKPVQKVGPEMAVAICNGEPHLFKIEIDQAHKQGFEDGQQHAFQIVADRLRALADDLSDAPGRSRAFAQQLRKWATEIESGAWAEDEASE